MKWIKRALPHLTIILALMTLTFFCIDRVNTGMAFMTSELSKWVFMLLAVSGLLSSLMLIASNWRHDMRQARKQQRNRHRAAMAEWDDPTDTQTSSGDESDN